jgi:hypothetical protein
MKKIYSLIICFSVTVLSCNNNTQAVKETSPALEKDKAPFVDDNIISFTANGENVLSAGHNISRFKMDGKTWINITSSMYKNSKTINMNIAADKIGTYFFDVSSLKNTNGSYYPDYMKKITNSYRFISGEVTITSIDTAKGMLNAIFKGTVQNAKKETIEIKNGKVINGKLKPGITTF